MGYCGKIVMIFIHLIETLFLSEVYHSLHECEIYLVIATVSLWQAVNIHPLAGAPLMT